MLKLIVNNARHPSAAEQTLRYCDSLLSMRREQASQDLAFYNSRRTAIARTDPQDRSGLLELYDLHIDHLASLVAHIDAGARNAGPSRLAVAM